MLAFGKRERFVGPSDLLELLLPTAFTGLGDIDAIGSVRSQCIHGANEDADGNEAAHEISHRWQNQPKEVHSLNQGCTCDGQSSAAAPRRFKRTAQA